MGKERDPATSVVKLVFLISQSLREYIYMRLALSKPEMGRIIGGGQQDARECEWGPGQLRLAGLFP